jgi:hypothetical protein
MVLFGNQIATRIGLTPGHFNTMGRETQILLSEAFKPKCDTKAFDSLPGVCATSPIRNNDGTHRPCGSNPTYEKGIAN